jgi:hypothetical protein
MTKDIKHLIGCTGIFDKKGLLHVHPHLKTFRVSQKSAYPTYTIIGDDNKGNVLVTADHVFVSQIHKKFLKELEIDKTLIE